jgi:hypothetical protein
VPPSQKVREIESGELGSGRVRFCIVSEKPLTLKRKVRRVWVIGYAKMQQKWKKKKKWLQSL